MAEKAVKADDSVWAHNSIQWNGEYAWSLEKDEPERHHMLRAWRKETTHMEGEGMQNLH